MPEAVAQKIKDLWGLGYIEGYDLSETIAPTHINPAQRPKKQCLGIPIYDTDSRITDREALRELSVQEAQDKGGEIGSLGNFATSKQYLWLVFWIVLLGDLLAFSLAYTLGWVTPLPERDRRALAFETGKRNTRLGLVLVFGFFDGLGAMALVAAWWGTWDIVMGTALADWWRRRPL